jgi:aspartyl-tRNA(Asn)/glutamyl-tRNA(Gln) amidotransferase subunit C
MEIDVKRTAALAALQLSENEENKFAKQLPSIFDHFKQLADINTEGVEPLVTPIDIKKALRQDKAESWESSEVALSNAPDKSGNLFKVPPVV